MRYSVTAVVVSYNREELLAECLAGIDRQTRQPDHLIVIDNASTDGSIEVLRKWQAVSPRAPPSPRAWWHCRAMWAARAASPQESRSP